MAEGFKAPALKAGGLYYMVSQVRILFLLGGVVRRGGLMVKRLFEARNNRVRFPALTRCRRACGVR